jgi:hypothetical protein
MPAKSASIQRSLAEVFMQSREGLNPSPFSKLSTLRLWESIAMFVPHRL